MLFLQKGHVSLIRLTSSPDTCFSTCLVMSSVVQLASDFVFTPYVLRQRHGIKVFPPPMTRVWYWWCPRWAACSIPLCQSPRDFSPQETCISFSPNGAHNRFTVNPFSKSTKIASLLFSSSHDLIALFEQASSQKKNYAGRENHFWPGNGGLPLISKEGKESHFKTEYRKTPLPANKKGPVREAGPTEYRKEKKSWRDLSTSLKQARAPVTETAELS